ncbi:hypothetical protein RR42_s1492 [Cupriavidus basilensis]|uniref:Uncharacterized protein n=1 Tax=Cupriavidus basilensis TaxID=68895 RepID=A0A0C4YKJ7_9BURK|nr:hypothetical protein RR42_s1492 [Cupriavidus basilensis]
MSAAVDVAASPAKPLKGKAPRHQGIKASRHQGMTGGL